MNDKIYITRDKDGTLAILEGKPIYDEELDTFTYDDDGNGDRLAYLNEDLYPEVTYENSPVELKPAL